MFCPRPDKECEGACKEPGCAICPQCKREFFLEEGETPGALCCICKANQMKRFLITIDYKGSIRQFTQWGQG